MSTLFVWLLCVSVYAYVYVCIYVYSALDISWDLRCEVLKTTAGVPFNITQQKWFLPGKSGTIKEPNRRYVAFRKKEINISKEKKKENLFYEDDGKDWK